MIFSKTHYRSAVLVFINGWPLFTMDILVTPGPATVYHGARGDIDDVLAGKRNTNHRGAHYVVFQPLQTPGLDLVTASNLIS